jgi:hypothetical protein
VPPREPKATPPVDTSWRDAPVPTDEEGWKKVISQGIARNLQLACTPKELAEACKVAMDWHKTLYGTDENEGLGTGLTAQGATGNGHGR